MRRISLPLLLAVAACAGDAGPWPSLARRPIEGPPLAAATAEPRRCAALTGTASCLPTATAAPGPAVRSPMPVGPAAPTQPPTPPVAIDDVPAKLAVIDRDLTDAADRLAAQRTAATAAAAAAHGSSEGPAWSKAQLELTALDRVGNQVGDIRSRLDAIAGQLAAASAGGGDVAAPLAMTGRLIARATVLQGDYETAATALR